MRALVQVLAAEGRQVSDRVAPESLRGSSNDTSSFAVFVLFLCSSNVEVE
jgi:hypothetical protein